VDTNLAIICGLTFVIHLVGTLAYAARIAGIRTGQIATALTLFNLLVLVSRTSNTFQAPFLAKRIETLTAGATSSFIGDFQWILASAALATAIGAFLIPSAQRAFARAVSLLQSYRSIFRLVAHSAHPRRILSARRFLTLPSIGGLTHYRSRGGLTWGLLGMNSLAVALWTVGVFAALYAGALEPSLRVTCATLSSIINGIATVMMFLVLDPQLSLLTDDALRHRLSEGSFRSAVASLLGARFVGVVLAQFLLVPSALLICYVARHI